MKRRIAAVLLLLLLLLTGCAAESAAPVERRDGASAAAQTPAPMERVEAAANGTEESAPAPAREAVIDEASGKTVLTLAGVRMQAYGWDALAKQFNAQSADYIVELRV